MFSKFVMVPMLSLALVSTSFSGTATAAVISTQDALSSELRNATEAHVRDSLARDDVREAMQQLGVNPADADARVASLSDAELMQLQGQLDRLPAGGDGALAVIGIVFLVLLILELTGITNIFNRV